AKKHNIMNVLPVLIIEKMGPHFAIGDTCFTMEEDKPIYNPLDKKEIIARENEKTALRKTNMKEAYTNIHTDITLPYESIEFITVITKSGEKIDIIKNGKFVLKGCEELNKPFEK
ncbi:leucyl aminopeptidase, partial [candidate division WOR-3 bacterium]|nr:leucyl aminopeptidase [candidate division WOR-3 bacterium]